MYLRLKIFVKTVNEQVMETIKRLQIDVFVFRYLLLRYQFLLYLSVLFFTLNKTKGILIKRSDKKNTRNIQYVQYEKSFMEWQNS